MIEPHRNILCSYHYFKDYDFTRVPDLNIIADSGAFSAMSQGATINQRDLNAWAKDWPGRFKWIAALDVIGDPDKTRRNWQLAMNAGIEAIPTIHWGSDPSLMDWYVEQGVDLLGLGGMVGRPIPRQMRWLVSVFKHQQAHHPHVAFHGWGVTAPSVLRLPFYSVDSSGWAAVFRYGRAVVADARTGKFYTYACDGKDLRTKPHIGRLLRRDYGIDPADVLTSTSENRQLHARVALGALHVREKQLHRMHGPVAPRNFGVTTKWETPARPLHAATGLMNAAPDVVQREVVGACVPTAPNNPLAVQRNIAAADSDTK